MRGILRRGTVAAGVIALSLVFAAPAPGHVSEIKDGTNGPSALDIARASFGHSKERFRVSATTEDPWSADLLGAEDGVKGNDNAFQFQFNSTGDEYADYVVVVDYNDDGGLYAALYYWVPPYPTTEEPKYLSDVFVRKDGRTLRVSLKKRKINPRESYIGWKAESYYKDDNDCSHRCHDKAPNQGLVNHGL
jgi:hypothetical protein